MPTVYADRYVAGLVGTPNNVLGPPDGVFTTDTGNTNWAARWEMAAVAGTLQGTQTITVRARREASGGTDPSFDINLWYGGTTIRTLITGVIPEWPYTDTVVTFDASEVTGGSLVRIEVSTSGGGGAPGSRRAVQVDSITWDAQIAATLEDEAADANSDAAILSEVQFSGIVDDELEDTTADDTVLSERFDRSEDVLETADAESVDYLLVRYSEERYTTEYYVYSGPGLITDDILEDTSSFAEPVVQARQVTTDQIEDATADPVLVSQVRAAVEDLLEDTGADPVLVSQVRAAFEDALEDATADPALVSQVRAAAVDSAEDVGGDETVLTDVQTGAAGEELTEQFDREDTILQQIATFRQDVEELAAGDVAVTGEALYAVEDTEEFITVDGELILEAFTYRQDVASDGTAEAVLVNTNAALSSDLLEDTSATLELLSATMAALADEEAVAEGKGDPILKDDIEESAVATAEVPTDPLKEDIYEWIWPRARIANKYVADVEETPVARDAVFTKLKMDIVVDVDALTEVVNERRDNRTDLTATAIAEDLFEATIAALADVEQEAYIGGVVTNGAGSFYNALIEDADGSDELTQRLVTSDDLAVDANGRDDVAATAWFKAHSFIEEATASDTLLSELIRRPTKDDVMDTATGDVDMLTARLDAIAAWSEEATAEVELLGNESGEAWVFNSRTLAFSRYVEFEASQVTTVDSEPLAAGSRGVMNYGTNHAEGFVKTGLSDYGDPRLKRIRHAYVTAASRQPLSLATLQGIGDTLARTTYQVDTLDSTVPYTHRLNLARGDQGQFWAFELRAPAGPPTTLLNLRIIPLVTSRRI